MADADTGSTSTRSMRLIGITFTSGWGATGDVRLPGRAVTISGRRLPSTSTIVASSMGVKPPRFRLLLAETKLLASPF